MEEINLLKSNSFRIVGKLEQVELETKVSKQTSATYISGNIVVSNEIDGKKCIYDISLYANELTNDKKPSQLFKTYSNLNMLVGKKVQIDGSIRENRYFNTKAEQMVSSQQLSGKFIKGVPENSVDCATWEVGGFVLTEPVEKANKDGEVYGYDISLAQANYREDNLCQFTFRADPTQTNIVNGIKSYQAGDTIILKGKMYFTEETVTVESDSEGGFGEPIIRTYVNKQKNWYITGGSQVIRDNRSYANETIRNLVSAYKAKDAELIEQAKSKVSDDEPQAVETNVKPTTRQTSLL